MGRFRAYRTKMGHGPAWENSLFEDNAEFGLGMALAQNAVRGRLAELTEKLVAIEYTVPEIKEAAKAWLDAMTDSTGPLPTLRLWRTA